MSTAFHLVILCLTALLLTDGSTGKKKKANAWTPWSKYGPCSVTCGIGKRFKRRICKAGKCNGKASSSVPCKMSPCPTKGRWSKWTAFGRCSKSCGQGVMIRNRKCIGGKCAGQALSKRRCNKPRCSGSGTWGPWNKFTKCSKTCGGGSKLRTRTCTKGTCKGPAKIQMPCATGPCARWGRWTKFGQCTKSCGGGQQQRSRDCKTKTCTGSSTQKRRCSTHSCKDGWSPCTKRCGTGTQYRYDSATCINPNNPKCFRTFRECNTITCKARKCPSGFERRYGSTSSCCAAEKMKKRIINGVTADIEQWKWMALLDLQSTICGGSLIMSNWVVTAGHCIDVLGGSGLIGLRVYVGIRNYSERLTSTPYTPEAIHKHPNHNDLKYDIALIKLTKHVNLFSSKISVISLPNGELTPTDSTCFTAGWGLTDQAGFTPSEKLLQVDVQVLNGAVCHKAYSNDTNLKDYILSTPNLVCAGSLSIRNDACRGDSGGPLVCQRCSSCEWYLAGLTSFGPLGQCGRPGYPGMYTRVEKFEAWIYKVIPMLKPKTVSKCLYKYGP